MSNERIKQRIRNLLELGRQSTFPNEAASAKNQALTLLRRHNLSEKDLYDTPKISYSSCSPEEEYAQQIVDLLILRQKIAAMRKVEQEWMALRKKKIIKEAIIFWLVTFAVVLATIVATVFLGAKG